MNIVSKTVSDLLESLVPFLNINFFFLLSLLVILSKDYFSASTHSNLLKQKVYFVSLSDPGPARHPTMIEYGERRPRDREHRSLTLGKPQQPWADGVQSFMWNRNKILSSISHYFKVILVDIYIHANTPQWEHTLRNVL